MIAKPKTAEESSDLREWLVSLVEDLPDDRLVKLANAIEDAAFPDDGNDPFYSEDNMRQLKESIVRPESARKG